MSDDPNGWARAIQAIRDDERKKVLDAVLGEIDAAEADVDEEFVEVSKWDQGILHGLQQIRSRVLLLKKGMP